MLYKEQVIVHSPPSHNHTGSPGFWNIRIEMSRQQIVIFTHFCSKP